MIVGVFDSFLYIASFEVTLSLSLTLRLSDVSSSSFCFISLRASNCIIRSHRMVNINAKTSSSPWSCIERLYSLHSSPVLVLKLNHSRSSPYILVQCRQGSALLQSSEVHWTQP